MTSTVRPARRITAAVLGALVLGTVAACGSAEEKTSAPTEKVAQADSLVIYSGRNEKLVGPILEKLKAATGTKVEVRYGDSAELAAQLLEEGSKTKAGLFFSQDAGALGALAEKGMLAKLPQATTDKVDAAYRAADGSWVGVSGRVRVIAYNPAKAPTPPAGVRELTKPEWKGKIGYAPTNASFHAFVTGMRVLDGDEATRKWLKDFKANEPKAYEKNDGVLNAVDSGEVSLGLINHYYWYAKVAEKGADKVTAKLSFPQGGDPGALVNVAGVGMLKGGNQGDAAQKAVDFLLSAEAQKYFADKTKEYPLAAGVQSGIAELPALNTVQAPKIDLGKLSSLEQTLGMIREAGML